MYQDAKTASEFNFTQQCAMMQKIPLVGVSLKTFSMNRDLT